VVSSASINQRTKLIRRTKPWFNIVIDQFPVIFTDRKLLFIVKSEGFYRVFCKIHKRGRISAMLESLHHEKMNKKNIPDHSKKDTLKYKQNEELNQ